MGAINKQIIAPLAAGVFLFIKQVFGIEVGTAEQDVYVDAILAGITLVGIFMKPKNG